MKASVRFGLALLSLVAAGTMVAGGSPPPDDETRVHVQGFVLTTDEKPVTNLNGSICYHSTKEYDSTGCRSTRAARKTKSCFSIQTDAQGKFSQTLPFTVGDSGISYEGGFTCYVDAWGDRSSTTSTTYTTSLDLGFKTVDGIIRTLGGLIQVEPNPETGAAVYEGQANVNFRLTPEEATQAGATVPSP